MFLFLKDRLHSYVRDDFVRHNAVFFIGSMAVAILNYAYHPIVSRLLSIEAFGEVQAYLSIAAQLGIVASVFGMIILNIQANATDEHRSEDSHHMVSQLYSLSTLVTALTAGVLILFAPYLGRLFDLPNFLGFALVASTLLVSTPRIFAKFHLQAEKMFTQVSVTEIIVSGGKILVTILFILAGTEVAGALAGLLIATLAGLLYVYPYTKDTIGLAHISRIRFTPALWRELRYGTLILVAIAFSTFLYTADILVVRYFFDSETAGLYAGIATVARIIVFATGSVAGVTVAHIKLKNSKVENHAVMRKALMLIGLFACALLVVFSFLPALVVGLLMGERFLPLAHLLPLLSLVMVAVALVNLFVMYFLALRRSALMGIAALSSVSIMISTAIWHSTLTQVVAGFLAGIVLALILLSVLYSRTFR